MTRKMSRNVSIFVPAPQKCMGFIIGREGRNIKQLKRETRTNIMKSNGDKFENGTGFTVTGTEIDCEAAREAIQRRIEEWKENDRKSALEKASGFQTRSKVNDVKHTFFVPKEYMPAVVGTRRKNLENVETKSKTKVKVPSLKDTEAQSGSRVEVTITGSAQNCIRAEWLIKHGIMVLKEKMSRTEFGGDTQFVCIDIKDKNEKFQLKLDGNSPKLDGHLQGQRYRIEIDDDESNDQNEISDGTVMEIKNYLSAALEKLNTKKDAKLMSDLWCHFGKALVSNVDEEDTEPRKTFTQVDFERQIKKIVSNDKAENADYWKVSFEEGVDPSVQDLLPESEDDEDSFPCLKLVHTRWRYDFGFGTPSCRNVRMKAWRGLPSRIDDQPPDEVKNILVPVIIQAEKDIKAWLCYPSVTVLRGEIVTPTSEYDCRMKLRTGSRYVSDKDSVCQEEDKTLSDYLSHCTLDKKDDNVTLCLPDKDPPEGFGCIFFREAEERIFSSCDNDDCFTVIVLNEKGWDSDGVDRREQKQFGIRVLMDSWSEALLSPERQWTPKEILDKLENYMEFLSSLKNRLLF